MILKAKNVVILFLCCLSLAGAESVQETHKRLAKQILESPDRIKGILQDATERLRKKRLQASSGRTHSRAPFRSLQAEIPFSQLETDLQTGNLNDLKIVGQTHQELKAEITKDENNEKECVDEEPAASPPAGPTTTAAPFISHSKTMEWGAMAFDKLHVWVVPLCLLILLGGIGAAFFVFWDIWHHLGFDKKELQSRAKARYVLLVTFICLLALWVSSGGAILSTLETLETADKGLDVITGYSEDLLYELDILQPTIEKTLSTLTHWNDTCAVLVNGFLTKMDVEMDSYLCLGGTISDKLVEVREMAEIFVLLLKEAGLFLTSSKAAPILLVTSVPNIVIGLILGGLVAAAVMVGKGHNLCLQNFFEDSMKFLAFPLSALILLMTIVAVIMIFVEESLSQLCKDVDVHLVNILRLLLDDMAMEDPDSAGTFEMVKNLVTYYLLGEGSNPLHEKLGGVSDILGQFDGDLEWLFKLGWIIAGLACPQLGELHAVHLVNVADGFAHTLLMATSRQAIYPVYDIVVHEGLCTNTPNNLVWLIVGQVFSVFLALPAVSYMIHRYVSQIIAWEKGHSRPPEMRNKAGGTLISTNDDDKTLLDSHASNGHGDGHGSHGGHGGHGGH